MGMTQVYFYSSEFGMHCNLKWYSVQLDKIKVLGFKFSCLVERCHKNGSPVILNLVSVWLNIFVVYFNNIKNTPYTEQNLKKNSQVFYGDRSRYFMAEADISNTGCVCT